MDEAAGAVVDDDVVGDVIGEETDVARAGKNVQAAAVPVVFRK